VLVMIVTSGLVATSSAQQQRSASETLQMLPVQGNVHLLTGAGANVTVSVGRNGVVLVDTPSAALVPQALTEIRKLSDKPIRYILNTSVDAEHVGGNAAVVGASSARGGAGAPFAFVGLDRPAIFAHEAVLNRLSNPGSAGTTVPAAGLPTTEYFQPSMDLFVNGEAIVLYHQPAAHTDGDSLVFFRRSDVISTGDVFTPGRYPAIDLARGGSVTGLIAALTNILELAVPEAFESGGTQIVPGHGRICEETDVAEFRDMVVIVRDRIRDLMGRGRSLEAIKMEKPSRDYDREYHASPADADRFVESIYRSLSAKPGGKS
jgi:glyoxylase-like metal-dependent hydrolase (beta-lactamase superfamily II)